MNASAKIVQRLKRDAHALGFESVGIARAAHDPVTAKRLGVALERNYHATMTWMEETKGRRSSPKNLWPGVCSIITLAMNYGPETNPLPELDHGENGVISVYARHRDYHDLIKGRLKTLAAKLLSSAKTHGLEGDVKVFVDTAPVMEKPLAQKAGVGWQGKHTNLVSRDHGSWLFLGSIFTTLDLPSDVAEIDHCGSCSKCLDICPTNAFPAPYQLDARRCISYLTIEHAGPIPQELREMMGNRIYGCDDCLAICPWNKFASAAREAKLANPQTPRPKALVDFLDLDDTKFRSLFAGSPVKRIGVDRFLRNCAIAAGNSDRPDLVNSLERLERTTQNDVTREATQWALMKLKNDNTGNIE